MSDRIHQRMVADMLDTMYTSIGSGGFTEDLVWPYINSTGASWFGKNDRLTKTHATGDGRLIATSLYCGSRESKGDPEDSDPPLTLLFLADWYRDGWFDEKGSALLSHLSILQSSLQGEVENHEPGDTAHPIIVVILAFLHDLSSRLNSLPLAMVICMMDYLVVNFSCEGKGWSGYLNDIQGTAKELDNMSLLGRVSLGRLIGTIVATGQQVKPVASIPADLQQEIVSKEFFIEALAAARDWAVGKQIVVGLLGDEEKTYLIHDIPYTFDDDFRVAEPEAAYTVLIQKK
ncbi:hypothetical protein BDZ85DRAFT_252815 [Elsinoe ampelina]|uniref:Uncharacterized protein n=1 Tax=Elsinoe ampelina TaxID=302913 RepID=A0A6A6G1Y6_9PEZI|nr:hypothetical protein BDZ85DRAFT_252815 [Elsinoe ampelina]